MQNQVISELHFRAGGKPGIWIALLVAFGLHLTILFLPANNTLRVAEKLQTLVELQLVKFTPPSPPAPEPTEATQPPELFPQLPKPVQEPAESLVETRPDPVTADSLPPPLPSELNDNLQHLSQSEVDSLTDSILARQFITEESVTERIFGPQAVMQITDPQKEFHIPERQGMISMLDQPMPTLPFEYTPGLIRFAYDPGVKGDLQRFWDVITPEFGWRTNNGTEFKCVWVLVIAACGWK
jgi:hypothetical protein